APTQSLSLRLSTPVEPSPLRQTTFILRLLPTHPTMRPWPLSSTSLSRLGTTLSDPSAQLPTMYSWPSISSPQPISPKTPTSSARPLALSVPPVPIPISAPPIVAPIPPAQPGATLELCLPVVLPRRSTARTVEVSIPPPLPPALRVHVRPRGMRKQPRKGTPWTRRVAQLHFPPGP